MITAGSGFLALALCRNGSSFVGLITGGSGFLSLAMVPSVLPPLNYSSDGPPSPQWPIIEIPLFP